MWFASPLETWFSSFESPRERTVRSMGEVSNHQEYRLNWKKINVVRNNWTRWPAEFDSESDDEELNGGQWTERTSLGRVVRTRRNMKEQGGELSVLYIILKNKVSFAGEDNGESNAMDVSYSSLHLRHLQCICALKSRILWASTS